MKFRDLFVPRWLNSNPDVRCQAVLKINDAGLLAQIAEKDEAQSVRDAANQRLAILKEQI
jgi:hypothetical protein